MFAWWTFGSFLHKFILSLRTGYTFLKGVAQLEPPLLCFCKCHKKKMKSFVCFQVVLFTTLELYNEDDVINHHGFERSVTEAHKVGRKNNVPHTIAKTFGKNYSLLLTTFLVLWCLQRSTLYPLVPSSSPPPTGVSLYLATLATFEEEQSKWILQLLMVKFTVYNLIMVKLEYNYFSIQWFHDNKLSSASSVILWSKTKVDVQ